MASEDLPANGHGGPADPSPKQQLRRAMRSARADYVDGLGAQRGPLEADLALILARNLGHGSVAAYHAMGNEIDPGPTETSLLPRVAGANLTFHRCALTDLIPGFAGIAEPPAGLPAVDPDIVLVPLVAVDPHGNRLGQGAGHYDRTLAALRARGPVFAVGVAWDMQVVDALPADPWDERLDALATPSRWLTFGTAPPTSR